VDLYRVMGEVVTGVQEYPDEGYYNTLWLMGLWSTQAKVEGIALKAAWHWGSDSSVTNDPLGEPGCTPLYVDLSTWGPVVRDRMFTSYFMRDIN